MLWTFPQSVSGVLLVERKTVDFSRLYRDFVICFSEFDLSRVYTVQILCMVVYLQP